MIDRCVFAFLIERRAMPTIDLLRDHQKLYLGKMCAMGCGICMCSTHVRELLCVVLLSFFCFIDRSTVRFLVLSVTLKF